MAEISSPVEAPRRSRPIRVDSIGLGRNVGRSKNRTAKALLGDVSLSA
jgi:hypothetical protein